MRRNLVLAEHNRVYSCLNSRTTSSVTLLLKGKETRKYRYSIDMAVNRTYIASQPQPLKYSTMAKANGSA